MLQDKQFKRQIQEKGRSASTIRKTDAAPTVIQVVRVKPPVSDQKIVDFKQALPIAKVIYLQDLKQFTYKLDCDPQFICSLLGEPAKSCQIIYQLVPNQAIQTELMKEQNFSLIAGLIHSGSQNGFRIIHALLQQTHIQPTVLQLLHKFKINFNLFLEQLKTPECQKVTLNLIQFCCDQSALQQFVGSKTELIQNLIFFLPKNNQHEAVSLIANLLTSEQQLTQQAYEDLVRFVSYQIQTSKEQSDGSKLVAALQLLANSLQMPQMFIAFLNQDGFKQLGNLIENSNVKVKEATIAVYTQMLSSKASDVSIVIESHYINDLLNLDPSAPQNHPTVKNILLFLVLIM